MMVICSGPTSITSPTRECRRLPRSRGPRPSRYHRHRQGAQHQAPAARHANLYRLLPASRHHQYDVRRFVSVREFTRNGFQHIQRRDQTLYHTNSLVTITKLPRARRSTPNRLIGSRVSGTIIAGDAEAIAATSTPSSNATSSSLARTIPMISSSSPRHTGTDCAVKRAVARGFWPEISVNPAYFTARRHDPAENATPASVRR